MKQIILHIQNGGKGTDIIFPCEEYMLSKSLKKIGIGDAVFGNRYAAEVVEPKEFVVLENHPLELGRSELPRKTNGPQKTRRRKKLFSL